MARSVTRATRYIMASPFPDESRLTDLQTGEGVDLLAALYTVQCRDGLCDCERAPLRCPGNCARFYALLRHGWCGSAVRGPIESGCQAEAGSHELASGAGPRGPRTTDHGLSCVSRRYPADPAQPGAQQARDGGAAGEPRGWHRRERDVVQRHGRAAVQAAAGRDRIVTARVGAHEPVQRRLIRPDVLPRLPLDETGRAGVPVARRLRRFARDGGASRRPFAARSRGVGVAGVLPGDRHGRRCQPARHRPGAARGHQRRVVEGTGRAGGSDRPATR